MLILRWIITLMLFGVFVWWTIKPESVLLPSIMPTFESMNEWWFGDTTSYESFAQKLRDRLNWVSGMFPVLNKYVNNLPIPSKIDLPTTMQFIDLVLVKNPENKWQTLKDQLVPSRLATPSNKK